jgi:hypothetical protein
MLILMEFDDQPGLGGIVLIAANYSIQLRCVVNLAAIPFRGIVMLVKCAICGHVANVNPRIASIQGHRPHRKMENPPDLWVCDIHFIRDKESL